MTDDQEQVILADQVSLRRRIFNLRTIGSLVFGLVLLYLLSRVI